MPNSEAIATSAPTERRAWSAPKQSRREHRARAERPVADQVADAGLGCCGHPAIFTDQQTFCISPESLTRDYHSVILTRMSSPTKSLVADDVEIVRRILAHIDAGTTDEGEAWREPVENYLNPSRFAEELRLLRTMPSVFVPSATIPNPGDHVERTAFGVPLFAVRGRDRTGARVPQRVSASRLRPRRGGRVLPRVRVPLPRLDVSSGRLAGPCAARRCVP